MKINKNISANLITFTYSADDEDPNCMNCDNCCTDSSIICDCCGPEFCWANYVRTEKECLTEYLNIFKKGN